MPVIDDILKLLEDGKWHDLKDTAKKSKLHEFKVEMILNFLAGYNFIDLDKEKQKAKLTPATLTFIREIQRLERKATLRS